MGGQKLLLPLRGRPMVRWSVEAALGSQASRVVVVAGHEGDAVAEALEDLPVEIVVNPDFADGMSTSLQAGIRAAGPCEAVVFLLGDQPFVTASLVDRLIGEFARTGKLRGAAGGGGTPREPGGDERGAVPGGPRASRGTWEDARSSSGTRTTSIWCRSTTPSW